MDPRISVKVGKLRLANPVMVASGTFGYAEEFAPYLDCSRLGAVVTKTITLNPRQGNPPPRTCETPAGLLNSIGLENPGVERFITEKLPYFRSLKVPVIVSIAAEEHPDEFGVLVKRLARVRGIAALELNISCPNVVDRTGKHAALVSQDPTATCAVVGKVRRWWKKTLITKLSPNVTSIVAIARAAERGGSDALALINTLTGMAIDITTRRPKIARITAGLSGPAIRPVAVRMVWEVSRAVHIPVIGMGGITDAASALEFIIAGASAVSVGTAHFINPAVCMEIIDGIRQYCVRHRIADITKIRGVL